MLNENEESLTYFEVLQRASSFLAEIRHSSFVAEWLMRERLNWTKTDLVLHYQKVMPEEEFEQFEKDFKAFLKGQPMQQIIGHEWYFNRKFKVTKNTLIPRPETEEWQDRVLTLLKEEPSLEVVDIGTGTGVLGLTHKLERPQDQVTVTDIEPKALEVAKQNAKDLGAEVSFSLGDSLEAVAGKTFDVILCNPPYISEKERDVMDQSVLDFEPHTALFADENGLAFYQAFAKHLPAYLKPNARVFLEIGYKQGPAVKEIFQAALPEARIECWLDFNQHDRVIAINLK